MSYLKPDYHYKPSSSIFTEEKKEESMIKELTDLTNVKQSLLKNLQEFSIHMHEEDMVKFYNNTVVTSLTTINALDSVSFLRKFIDGYIASLQMTFPHITPEKLSEIKESLLSLEKIVADILKSSNIENKFLLPLVSGLLYGLLNYENY